MVAMWMVLGYGESIEIVALLWHSDNRITIRLRFGIGTKTAC